MLLYLLTLATLLLLLILFGLAQVLKFKRSRAGIAFGIVNSITGVCLAGVFAMSVNWPTIILRMLVNGAIDLNDQIAAPTVVSAIATTTITITAIIAIGVMGHRALRNYSGPLYLSDDDTGLELENTGILAVAPIVRTKLVYFLTRKRDEVIIHSGENPYRIKLPTFEPSWRSLSLDLACSENSDIVKSSAKWSHTLACWVCENINYLNEDLSGRICIVPIVGEVPEINASALVSKIYAHKKQGEQISDVVFVCDNGPQEQLFFDDRFETPSKQSYRVVSKNTIVENSLDATEYCKFLIRKFEVEPSIFVGDGDTQNSLSIRDSFVPLRAYQNLASERRRDLRPQKWHEITDAWLEEDSREQLGLLGEFGQGKSTAMLEYAAQWAREYLEFRKSTFTRGRIPLLIELRGRSPKDLAGPEDILGEWGSRFGLRGDALFNLVKCGRALLIFEGFDEVQNAGGRLDRYEQFNALWQFAFSNSKIIFTGRPNFFIGADETKSIMRVSGDYEPPTYPSTRVYTLDFLSIDDIRVVLRNAPETTRNEIIELAKSDKSFLNIAQRPSMLPIIASEWRNIRRLQTQSSEITPAEVLDGYIKSTFKRKEPDPTDLQLSYQLVKWQLREFLTQAVAISMLAEDGKNSISAAGIERAIEKIEPTLDSIFLGPSGNEVEANDWRVLKERFSQSEDAGASLRERVRALAQEVRANGLLAPDPAGGSNSFYFPHKQFYEFLIARFYFEKFEQSSPAKTKALAKLVEGISFSDALAREPLIGYHLSMMYKPNVLSNRWFHRTNSPVANAMMRFVDKTITKLFFFKYALLRQHLLIDTSHPLPLSYIDKSRKRRYIVISPHRMQTPRASWRLGFALFSSFFLIFSLAFPLWFLTDELIRGSLFVEPSMITILLLTLLFLGTQAILLLSANPILFRFPSYCVHRFRLSSDALHEMYGKGNELAFLEQAWMIRYSIGTEALMRMESSKRTVD